MAKALLLISRSTLHFAGSLPKTRLELVLPYDKRILSPQRLPISPLGPGIANELTHAGCIPFLVDDFKPDQKVVKVVKVAYPLYLCNFSGWTRLIFRTLSI